MAPESLAPSSPTPTENGDLTIPSPKPRRRRRFLLAFGLATGFCLTVAILLLPHTLAAPLEGFSGRVIRKLTDHGHAILAGCGILVLLLWGTIGVICLREKPADSESKLSI